MQDKENYVNTPGAHKSNLSMLFLVKQRQGKLVEWGLEPVLQYIPIQICFPGIFFS